jgi:hypothetical protein
MVAESWAILASSPAGAGDFDVEERRPAAFLFNCGDQRPKRVDAEDNDGRDLKAG